MVQPRSVHQGVQQIGRCRPQFQFLFHSGEWFASRLQVPTDMRICFYETNLHTGLDIVQMVRFVPWYFLYQLDWTVNRLLLSHIKMHAANWSRNDAFFLPNSTLEPRSLRNDRYQTTVPVGWGIFPSRCLCPRMMTGFRDWSGISRHIQYQ